MASVTTPGLFTATACEASTLVAAAPARAAVSYRASGWIIWAAVAVTLEESSTSQAVRAATCSKQTRAGWRWLLTAAMTLAPEEQSAKASWTRNPIGLALVWLSVLSGD